MDCIIHGEVFLYKSKLPKDARKLDEISDYKIIANSETTGNHHVIDIEEGIEFYEKDGVLYLKNENPATVRCLVKERHDNIVLEPGVWEIENQQEYDYFTERSRKVSD